MLRAVLRFVKRHAWSLSLSGLSAVSFLQLASEIREDELGPFDHAVAGWVEAARGRWDLPMQALTRLGEVWAMASVCLLFTLLLAALGRRREALYVLTCGAGAGALCTVLKLFFHRARPSVVSQYLLQAPHSFSFPSGHAMGATGVIGSLVLATYVLRVPLLGRVAAIILGAALLVGIAASRIYFGVHYPSDVLGGQLAGAAWIAAVTGWFYPRLLPAEASGTASS